MKAQYLLRFDDLCPTMNWHVWNNVEKILCEYDIKPILAVVPDNEDDALRVSSPNPKFWDRARKWQSRGWTIGMHGWQHRFVTTDSGMLGIQPCSEFAGLPREEQKRKIQSGLSVFEKEGIKSKIWIAPAHSFDATTIQLLVELGFRHMSDGSFLLPHVDRFGMTWVPQQLWSFRWRPLGVWTICFHMNRWTREDIRALQANIEQFRESISTFGAVTNQYNGRQDTILDSVTALAYRAAAHAKEVVREFSRVSFRTQIGSADKTAP
jgi:predicted deacetylase